MPRQPDQILTAAQMRAAEDALIQGGSSVDALMQIAGRGAADWVWRMAGHHKVTVLCGPGNNGGDGYVIAEAIRERGGKVSVVAAADPATDAARTARALYRGDIAAPDDDVHGEVFVDCLFGSGLNRPIGADHAGLLGRLAARHRHRIAIDLPSGVGSDTGERLNTSLPDFDLTIALGAWKFAHVLMPACGALGALQLVDIGVAPVKGAARLLPRPHLSAPGADDHKYRRGLVAVIGGAMPGAAMLACTAAQGAGAGYVKLIALEQAMVPADVVVSTGDLGEALSDSRIGAVLIGPGLGRDEIARSRLDHAFESGHSVVLDADALMIVTSAPASPAIATPHDGELAALERTFACDGSGSKPQRAHALAKATGMVIVAKGPDTVVAAPDGRIACAPRATSWLSVAGTGDVLAGVIASRLAGGADPFGAACQGVWLHAEAARLSGPAFAAGQLAARIPASLAACL